MDICLWYPKGDNFELIGFSDDNFSGCKVERKNTSDYYQKVLFCRPNNNGFKHL